MGRSPTRYSDVFVRRERIGAVGDEEFATAIAILNDLASPSVTRVSCCLRHLLEKRGEKLPRSFALAPGGRG